MFHPLIKLAATRPLLLAEHLGAYAELAAAEVAELGQAIKSKAAYSAMALGFGLIGALLAGFSALLAAAIPIDSMPAAWVLLALPLGLLLVAAVLYWMGARQAVRWPIDDLKKQWAIDAALIDRAQSAQGA